MYCKLFHKDVFFPQGVEKIVSEMEKRFNGYVISYHLQEHLDQENKDRSHDYLGDILTECLETLKENNREAFEVELGKDQRVFGDHKWHITKYCCRIPYKDGQDIAVAIRPQFDKEVGRYNWNKNLVVTAWLNRKGDNHNTLDTSKYCSQKEWALASVNRG